ncbi:MAG: TonB-dependent receptor [Salibacteraceae bacterium]
MKTKFTLLLLSLLFTTAAMAQNTGTIRGFVYDGGSGEPVIFTNVIVQGTTIGATTDDNGYFSITDAPVGKQTVICTALGYDTAKSEVLVTKGKISTIKLVIKEVSVELNAFEVSAEQQEQKTEVKVSSMKVTVKDIQKLPSVGGESDIAQYLQVLPGVVFTGDQGGQLYIRGGSPVQNRIQLDGMNVYNPFHSIGLYSVFETEIIKNADVSTGGFNAEHGGAISSVMNISTIDGNRNRMEGKIGASTFGAKIALNGPIKKPTEVGGSSITYVLSAKTSYLDKTSESIYSYVNDGDGLPYSFLDAYGKIAFHGTNGSKFNVFGFNFTDNVDYTSSTLDWKTYGAGSNFILVPSSSDLLLEGNFSFSNYFVSQIEGDRKRSSEVGGFEVGLDFTKFKGDNTIKYGIDILGMKTDFNYQNSIGRKIEDIKNSTEFSGYFDYKIVAGKWVVEPSIRGIYYSSLSEFSVEPRIGLKYNASKKVRLKAAGGLYSQNLISSNSDKEVVNLFNGYLSSPDNLPSTFTEKTGEVTNVKSSLQKSIHYIVGVEWDVTKKISFNVEGYYKDYLQLIGINRYKIFEDNADNRDKPEILRKDYLIENGYAYGIDFTASYRHKGLSFWAVYSYGYTRRWDGIVEYAPVFDRRHNVNLVGSYEFGSDKSWTFNLRYNFGSGFPFTQINGYYEQFDFTDGLSTDFITGNGNLGTDFAPINQGRLPDYARLDVDVAKVFTLSQYTKLELNFGITNVLDRENIFYFDRNTYTRVNQLPFLPSIGASLKF